MCPPSVTPSYAFVGCGGTAPSLSLELDPRLRRGCPVATIEVGRPTRDIISLSGRGDAHNMDMDGLAHTWGRALTSPPGSEPHNEVPGMNRVESCHLQTDALAT